MTILPAADFLNQRRRRRRPVGDSIVPNVMTRYTHANPEELLAESSWLRGLARCLVHDPESADDLYQETVLAALRRGGTARGSLRPWLSGVARKVAVSWRRADARRSARERRVVLEEAEPQTEPGAAQIVERAALHRDVVDAVMGLSEPYRSTVLLRFFEDHPMAAVARAMEVPVETARTRLKRGLVMLRHWTLRTVAGVRRGPLLSDPFYRVLRRSPPSRRRWEARPSFPRPWHCS